MSGSGRFWQKWWFWLIAAAVVVAMPFSVKYAFAESETPALTEPTDAADPDGTLPVTTEGPTADTEPAEETEAPTESLTQTPTEAPTEGPTEPPAGEPTEEPTEPPAEDPTEAPTDAPTEPPTEPPVEEPTALPTEPATQPQASGTSYVLNKNTKKFHYPTCSSVSTISAKNREDTDKSREEIIAMGYSPCGRCKP